MALLDRIVTVLAATEETYGAFPSSGAFKAVLCNKGAEITPKGDRVERDILRSTFSPLPSRVGAKRVGLTLTTELRGGGLGVGGEVLPPDCDALLLACGCQRTAVLRLTADPLPSPDGAVPQDLSGFLPGDVIVAPEDVALGILWYIDGDTLVLRDVTGNATPAEPFLVTGFPGSGSMAEVSKPTKALEYRPLTSGPDAAKSAHVQFYKHTILQRVSGIRGTALIDCQVGKIPTIKFSLTGLWVDPADQDAPNPNYTNVTGPVFVNARAKFGGYAPVLSSLTLDLGVTVSERVSANGAEGLLGQIITGRRAVGSLDPEVEPLATFNPWTAWKAGGTARLCATIGDSPGNRIRLEVPKAGYENVAYGSRVDLATYKLDYVATVDRDGDDEWRLTFF